MGAGGIRCAEEFSRGGERGTLFTAPCASPHSVCGVARKSCRTDETKWVLAEWKELRVAVRNASSHISGAETLELKGQLLAPSFS